MPISTSLEKAKGMKKKREEEENKLFLAGRQKNLVVMISKSDHIFTNSLLICNRLNLFTL